VAALQNHPWIFLFETLFDWHLTCNETVMHGKSIAGLVETY